MNSLFVNKTGLLCEECGDPMFLDDGVAYHGEPDERDYDADADHTARADEAEIFADVPAVVVTITVRVTDDNDAPIRDAAVLQRVADRTKDEIEHRLFGEGYLPDDITLAGYTIAAQVQEPAKVTDPLAGVPTDTLMRELRSRGLVPCVFEPGDVVSNHLPEYDGDIPETIMDAAGDWLAEHAERLEEVMTEAGNNYMAFASDPITDPDDEE